MALADEFDKAEDLNDAFDKAPDLSADFEAAPEALPDGTAPDSPLARALKEQAGNVVTVTDPVEGSLGRFTREGRRFMTPEEAGANAGANLNLSAQQIGRSFLSGGGPALDELAGVKALGESAADTVRRILRGDGLVAKDPLDVYRKARDAERRESRQAQEAYPAAAVAGQVAATLPAGFAGAGRGLGGRMLSQAAAQGAASAGNELMGSDIDLTDGGMPKMAQDVAKQALIGGGIGAAGELGASALGAATRYFGGKAQGAMDALAAQVQRAREKAVNSARGTLGGVVAGQNNIADTLRGVVSQPQFFEQPTADVAWQAINSPEGKTLMNRSVVNNVEKLSDALAREKPAREAFTEALEAAKPEAIAAEVARRSNPGNVVRDVGSKAMSSIGQRAALGAAGAGLGFMLGDTAGAGFGAGLGYMAPGALQFMRNAVKNPANQAVAFRAAEGALGGLQEAPHFASIIANTLASSPEKAADVPQGNYVMQRDSGPRDEEESIAAFLSGG